MSRIIGFVLLGIGTFPIDILPDAWFSPQICNLGGCWDDPAPDNADQCVCDPSGSCAASCTEVGEVFDANVCTCIQTIGTCPTGYVYSVDLSACVPEACVDDEADGATDESCACTASNYPGTVQIPPLCVDPCYYTPAGNWCQSEDTDPGPETPRLEYAWEQAQAAANCGSPQRECARQNALLVSSNNQTCEVVCVPCLDGWQVSFCSEEGGYLCFPAECYPEAGVNVCCGQDDLSDDDWLRWETIVGEATWLGGMP